MKCGSHQGCVELAMFFHSTGGTANLFPLLIYGHKQDHNSGVEVVCHYAVFAENQKLPFILVHGSVTLKMNPKAGTTASKMYSLHLCISCTHSRYKKLLDFLYRSPHLDLSSALCVFHCD